MSRVSAAEFERLFEPGTRAMLNWRRLRRERWAVDLEVYTDRKKLGQLYLPWARDSRRPHRQAELMAKHARLMRLREVPELLPHLDASRRAAILKLASGFEAARPSVLAVPAARAGKKCVVIDGCHRLSALMVSGVAVSAAVFVLDGPADARTIIDLELLLQR